MNEKALLFIFIGLTLFIIYFLIGMFLAENVNTYLDKWMRKTLWIWLPFYALWRLIREVIFSKR
ncbi:MAG: hypothetical protein CO140_04010 [Candidatus Moranbacteria bacterium CG_4_9_14_3_um_filter_40_7]|uniref:Uncharacterized protein n=1 Tax=Candidatus Nealsonbacteria bacterium CG23_combo_of_CG06-09_8_20_14_all_37_18 TaxID=1974720 RepID=A0A2G9YZ34_9BACT|nr:MAG: hypothetical protein COX35_00500 [Candidatus Nealsonbacteria bacterium CG23_combo_of_CG06-09_8_20_14_all_37_18]PIU80569.1 MAG: hypothetical protein COS71_02755 [Candidatus Moranbacteria bacterium CG06_land_8_20_14_3_00_40_12]PJA87483.1 MAG: hypothetical protein CO140_04010 [Candidatus Moranbacteria bacterium CG_4_9_14_3_um_filter_40_7]